jgi:multidrug efflux pump subunit AcrB
MTFGVTAVLGLLMIGSGSFGWGNLLVVIGLLSLLNLFVLYPLTIKFQNNFLPRLEQAYRRFLSWIMIGKRPIWVFAGTFGILILSFVLVAKFPTKVEFFPANEPNYINIFIEHPMGTDIAVTNRTTEDVKKLIDEVLNEEINNEGVDLASRTLGAAYSYNDIYNVEMKMHPDGEEYSDTIPLIESVIEQVGKGTSDPMAGPAFGETPHKARITVSFSEYSHRKGVNTSLIKQKVEKKLANWKWNIADLKITVDKEPNGPPQKTPVYVEITGTENYDDLVHGADAIKRYLNGLNVAGVQKVDTDVKASKAEFNIKLDRTKIRTSGMSYGQVASTVRTALFGKDISTYELNDEIYDLNVRFGHEFRGDIDELLNQKVMFMNNRGQHLTIPIISVVKNFDVVYKNTSIKRKNLDNVVVAFAGLEEGANSTAIVAKLKDNMKSFESSEAWQEFESKGVKFRFTGGMEEQEKEMAFLSKALGGAVFLILLIIVAQFNSFSTPIIILFAVVLSLAGVFLGIVITREPFVIIMTMIGIISLAGIVVNNAIVLIDYTNLIRMRKKEELGYSETQQLSIEDIKEAIVSGGQTRLRPVLLTAITTILGLLPLALGMNLDFFSLFTDYDPKIFFGGDNALFFGPMSKTIIFGLTFATFLTLVAIPVMYYLLYRFKLVVYRWFKWELKSDI